MLDRVLDTWRATGFARVLAAEHRLYPATLASYLTATAREPDVAATLANPPPLP